MPRFYWGVPTTFGFLSVRAGSKEVLLRLDSFFFSIPAGTQPAGHLPAGFTLPFLSFFSRVEAAFAQMERVFFLSFLSFLLFLDFLPTSTLPVSYQLYLPLTEIAINKAATTKAILNKIGLRYSVKNELFPLTTGRFPLRDLVQLL